MTGPLTEDSAFFPLRIGDEAPDFTARTTHGEFVLSSLRGRWVMLFAHPADFTPVCTSEFIAFAKVETFFRERNCVLLGLSADSLPAHLAWITAIEERFNVRIPFPIVEDPSMEVARAYGMMDLEAQDSATVRSVFFIDPTGIIRAILSYPASVGRSVAELQRMLSALQEVDRSNVLTPEGWQPGQAAIAPPLQTQEAVQKAGPSWFLQPKKPRP
ncbi:peroxiredoxin [Gluconobacter cerinus]|uniref:peroxiredoxin n=1 Tax=Gluconobacter TaxID=441 RepID=UPI001B8B1106|nr:MULTISPECIES: peroxiredoxin [Gluconobacter]MBS1031373.1 peroxiredoxin [Gluconobacter cerinus]